MRDRKRIDPFLARLATAWKKTSELRLGQLICNSISGDPFHVEDEEFVKAIEAFASRYSAEYKIN